MIKHAIKGLVMVGVVSMLWAAPARAEVVYDNTQSNLNFDHCPGGTEVGDQVTLAGTAREVTQIELAVTSVVNGVDVVVRLWANDATDGKPGTLLFESAVISVASAGPGVSPFTVAVPNVTVPDSFTWSVQVVGGDTVCVPRFDPPSVGSSDDFIWINSQGVFWFADNQFPVDNFYARITVAESDPVTLLTDLVGTVMTLNLQNGIANSLDAKLDAAINALDDMNTHNDVAAINSMEAFINAVEAQRGDKISSADADMLIAKAQQIIDLINGA